MIISIPMEIQLLRLSGKFRTIPKSCCLILLEKLKIWSKQYETSVYLAFEFAENPQPLNYFDMIDFRQMTYDKFCSDRDESKQIDGWVAFNIHSFEKVWISEYDLKYIKEFQKATEIV